MSCRPTTTESLDGLRQLQRAAAERGDMCFALLLAGVELYVRAGRDLELLETMRQHADDMRDAIENTPTADDLKRLYESDL
jgi:hypothetical protein